MTTIRPTTPARIQNWFRDGPISDQTIENLVKETQALKVRQLPERGDLLIENPHKRDKTGPKYWVIRLDDVIRPQDHEAIMAAFRTLKETPGLAWEEPSSRHNPAMDEENLGPGQKHNQLHLGFWCRQGNEPRVTASTVQGGNLAKQKATLSFLATVDRILRDRVYPRLKRYDSAAVGRAGGVTSKSRYELKTLSARVVEEVGGYPFRLGGLGTTLAIGVGSSPSYHLDRSDWSDMCYTVAIPISPGGWDQPGQKTGDFKLPQLGVQCPVRPGQAIALQSKHILHRVTAMTPEAKSKRLALSVFTDKLMAQRYSDVEASRPQKRKRRN